MTTDMPKKSWILKLPPAWIPYAQLMRLDRPTGIWLLFFPCAWSLSLADTEIHFQKILLFLAGAMLMRGAGCIWNDWVDRSFDRQVARTKTRPLASGTISSLQAFVFAILLTGGSTYILWQFNFFTICLGVSSLVLVAIYPFMKRITFWPQTFLGLTFSWGALMGWSSIRGSLGWEPMILYVASFFWILGYDTLYAYQDIEDDRKTGVKSTALYWGPKGKYFVGCAYGLFVCCLLLIKHLHPFSWVYGMGVFSVFFFLIRPLYFTDLTDPQQFLRAFKKNVSMGAFVWASFLVENFIQQYL